MRALARWCAGAAAIAVAASCSFDTSGLTGDRDGGDLIDADDPPPDPDAGDPGIPDAGADPDADPGAICEPGEPVCDGHTVRTCNEDGTGPIGEVIDECHFTCENAQCVFASNLPEAAYAACDDSAPALAPSGDAHYVFQRQGNSWEIACESGCDGGNPDAIARETRVEQDGDGHRIAVFCLGSLTLGAGQSLGIGASGADDAIALIVDGAAVIEGELDVSGRDATAESPGRRGPGGWDGGPLSSGAGERGDGGQCAGEGGDRDGDAAGGGGGAGHFGDGGDGGDGKDEEGSSASGGSGDGGCGDALLSPLVGGYGGGGGASSDCGGPDACGWPGGGGGGAIQISSRTSIEVRGTGVVAASGGDGYGEDQNADSGGEGGGGGGGAGGALLLEAPEIFIENPGAIRVEGGSGGESAAGPGGAGATGFNVDGHEGHDFEGSDIGGGSGGGGGGGRIRMNAEEGESPCEQVSPTGVCTFGPLLRQEP